MRIGVSSVAEQLERDGARPRKQPEDVRQVQVEREQDQHRAKRHDADAGRPAEAISDNASPDITRSDPARAATRRANTAASVRAMRRITQNATQNTTVARTAYRVDRSSVGRAVPQPFRADRLLEIARELLRQRRPRDPEARGVSRGHDHQQMRPDAQLGRSVHFGDCDLGIAQRVVVHRLFEAARRSARRERAGAYGPAPAVIQRIGSPPSNTARDAAGPPPDRPLRIRGAWRRKTVGPLARRPGQRDRRHCGKGRGEDEPAPGETAPITLSGAA